MSAYEEIISDFNKRGIPTESPDFYDHPNFIAAEQADSRYLNNYAFHAASRPYSDEYLAQARETIRITAEILYTKLVENGRQGACVDITGILARILEKHGIWCACIKGSCTIEFPKASSEETTYFYSVDNGSFVAGHAWLYAPPFDIIDLTIHHQMYSGKKNSYIPEFIISESNRNTKSSAADIINPEIILQLRRQGFSENKILEKLANQIPIIQEYFPAKIVDGLNGALITYHPVAIHASLEKLEGMENMNFNGESPFDMYQKHINPKLK